MKLNFIKVKNKVMSWRQIETKQGKVFMRMKFRTRKISKVPSSYFA